MSRRTATPEGEQALEKAAAWDAITQSFTGLIEWALGNRRRFEFEANRGGVTIDRIRDRLGCARSTVIEDLARAREDEDRAATPD